MKNVKSILSAVGFSFLTASCAVTEARQDERVDNAANGQDTESALQVKELESGHTVIEMESKKKGGWKIPEQPIISPFPDRGREPN